MEKIDHNIFVETDNLGSNNSMILSSRGIVLIDAPQKPTDAVRWREEVESKGEVSYLIHTDDHIDHTLTNAILPGTIISHEKTREKLTRKYGGPEFIEFLLSILDPGGMKLLPEQLIRLPTITLNDRLTLYLEEITLELMHLKGHTPNSIIIYLPEQKILFSGDIVCSAGLPSFQVACIFDWLETLKTIMEMDIRFVVPGHGDICDKSGIERFYNQINELIDKVKREIDQNRSREDIITTIRFPDHIHVSTDSYQGYPDNMIEEFQRRSIANIYDQLIQS